MTNLIDFVVVAVYLLGIVGIGCYTGLKRRCDGDARRFFLASHTLHWPAIGLALFATNISCVHLVSLAQAGFDQGLLMGNFEWMAAFTLILLSLFFVPFYIRSKVTTLPDFLEKRYDRECRDWLAVLSIVAAVVLHIAFPLATGWLVLHSLFGIDKWLCLVTICVLTAIYTVAGGLAAVVVTEMIQAIVLILGACLITVFAYVKAGGWSAVITELRQSGELIKLSMLRSPSVEPQFPWYAILLGYPVLGIWYWCADQTIVQRVLGAKDENHARLGPIFCAVLKVLPVFIFVLPGLLFSVILKQHAVAGVTVEDSKEVYGIMIRSLLPTGLFGVMAAALMAALMGNLASAANSISTLFSYDLWKRFKPKTTEKALVRIGRIATLLAFAVGIALTPLVEHYGSIFAGLNDVISHLAPPVTAVFLLGVFWPAASARSARWTLWIGSGMGALVYALKVLKNWQPEAFPEIPDLFRDTPFLMMAFILFVVCLALQVALTAVFPKELDTDRERLYWKNPLDALRILGSPGLAHHKVLAATVFILMLGLYVAFR